MKFTEGLVCMSLHTILAGLFKCVHSDKSFVRLCAQSKEIAAVTKYDLTVFVSIDVYQ
jgi:hypothetical protein